MRNLLRANFSRLWKSKALWLCAAGAFAFSETFGTYGETGGGCFEGIAERGSGGGAFAFPTGGDRVVDAWRSDKRPSA